MTITYIKAVAATLANNSDTITVSGEYVDFSKADDYLVALDNGLYVLPVLSGTAPDSNGDSTLTLASTWSGATLSNKSLFIFPTFAKIYESVIAMTALNGVTRGILTKLKDLLTDTKPTLDIGVGQTSSIETVPYGYLVNQVIDLIAQLNGLLGSVQAMTKAEFDRARLNELNNFPVAGTDSIDFDSSYEFQQINGWQNKFRINANKTCIDGVWHNYSNSDITLPAAPDGLDKKDLSGRFTNLAAAIMAGGDDLSQSYLNQRCIVYAVQKDIAAPFGLSTAYIQTAENNIYSNNGVLRQRSFEFVAERLLESVVIEGANTYQSTMNAMASIGWSQDSDVLGQFKKGNDIAVGLTIVQARNSGAYHPSHNSDGCGLLLNGTGGSSPKWYGLTTGKPLSLGDCFNPVHNNAPWVNGDRAKVSFIANGSGFNGRPDGKFCDAIYASDVKDLRMSSVKKTANEILKIYDRKDTSGGVRGFEGVPFSPVGTVVASTKSGGNLVVDLSKHGDIKNISSHPQSFQDRYYVWNITRSEGGVTNGVRTNEEHEVYVVGASPSVQVGDKVLVLANKPYGVLYRTHQQANPTWTDIIGSPENIAATFPDGVEGQWIPVIPDSEPHTWPCNRKFTSAFNVNDTVFTDDNGLTWDSIKWSNFTGSSSANLNTFGGGIFLPATRVQLIHYETKAHFTQDDVNSKVLAHGKVFAAARYNLAPIVSSIIGKVPTSSAVKSYLETPLTQATLGATGTGAGAFLGSAWGLEHTALDLGHDNNSPAAKTLSYVSSENGVAKLCYAYKEMVYDNGVDANDIIQVTGDVFNVVSGMVYRLPFDCSLGGIVVRFEVTNSSYQLAWVNQRYLVGGVVMYNNSVNIDFQSWNGNGWGDNNKFEIADYQNTMTDDNGNSVLHGTASFETQYFIGEE